MFTLLKGQFKSKIHIFTLTCRAIYQSDCSWCDMTSFENISHVVRSVMSEPANQIKV